MDVKRLRHVDIKDDDSGEVTLVFATFNEKDHDDDVTVPGAFDDGAAVPLSAYNHASSHGGVPPVGTAVIHQSSTEARAKAQFFMDQTDARNTFLSVKGLHAKGLGEWSYGYQPIKYDFGEWTDGEQVRFLRKQRVIEISPVMQGAGIGTRTLSAKKVPPPMVAEWSSAIRPHASPAETALWVAAKAVHDIDDGATVDQLRSMFAWVASGADPESKSSYMFPHHASPGGPANIRACIMGIAAVNAPDSQIPESDRKGVWNHLARHLREAGREPPELRSPDGDGVKMLQDDLMDYLSGVSDLLDSAYGVVAHRAVKGKSLSHVNAELLEWLYDEMQRLRSMFDTPDEEAQREYLRFIHLTQGE